MIEEWKDVIGYEGLYQVNNLGEVRRLYRNSDPKILKQHVYRKYKYVSLSKRSRQTFKRVHRLVAEAFIPNPSGKSQVNHINGNKLDNSANNLEWTTQSENMLHRYRKLKTKCSNGVTPKNVRCIETGEIFHNAMEASQIVGGDPCTIRRCANKEKYSKTSGGYHWEYIN